jgi:hypothetical protein
LVVRRATVFFPFAVGVREDDVDDRVDLGLALAAGLGVVAAAGTGATPALPA